VSMLRVPATRPAQRSGSAYIRNTDVWSPGYGKPLMTQKRHYDELGTGAFGEKNFAPQTIFFYAGGFGVTDSQANAVSHRSSADLRLRWRRRR